MMIEWNGMDGLIDDGYDMMIDDDDDDDDDDDE